MNSPIYIIYSFAQELTITSMSMVGFFMADNALIKLMYLMVVLTQLVIAYVSKWIIEVLMESDDEEEVSTLDLINTIMIILHFAFFLIASLGWVYILL